VEVVRAVDPRLRGTLAALRAQRMAAPITYESLLEAVDLWAETALTLTTRDLRLMERLARAQVRKAGGADEGAVEEIKRMELDTAWGELRNGNTGFGEERGTGITAWGAL
jgi:DSF synthase